MLSSNREYRIVRISADPDDQLWPRGVPTFRLFVVMRATIFQTLISMAI